MPDSYVSGRHQVTTQAHSHVSAWHAVNRACCDAPIDSPEQIIATKLRHETYAVVYAVLRHVEE